MVVQVTVVLNDGAQIKYVDLYIGTQTYVQTHTYKMVSFSYLGICMSFYRLYIFVSNWLLMLYVGTYFRWI